MQSIKHLITVSGQCVFEKAAHLSGMYHAYVRNGVAVSTDIVHCLHTNSFYQIFHTWLECLWA